MTIKIIEGGANVAPPAVVLYICVALEKIFYIVGNLFGG